MKLHFRDRIAAVVGALVLAALVLVSYYYALLGQIGNLRSTPSSDVPDYIARDVRLTEFDASGAASRRIYAQYAEHFPDGRMMTRRPRLATLYADRPQVKASADTGISLDSGKTAVFSGRVEVTRAGDIDHPPLRFTTSHLTVYPDESRMETDAFVRLESGSDVTTGRGMTLDNVDRTVDILSDVRTIVLPRAAQSQDVGQPLSPN